MAHQPAEAASESLRLKEQHPHEFPDDDPPALPDKPDFIGQNITVFEDHILVNNTYPLMRTRYF